MLGEDDQAVEHAIDMEAVRTHLDDLPEREQRILNLRFYGNLTQAEIGQRLGISQMHVSRLLTRALALPAPPAHRRTRPRHDDCTLAQHQPRSNLSGPPGPRPDGALTAGTGSAGAAGTAPD